LGRNMPDLVTVQLSQQRPFVATVRQGFFNDPDAFLDHLHGPYGEGWMRWIWKNLGREFAEEDCPGIENVDLPPDDITVSKHDIGHGVTVSSAVSSPATPSATTGPWMKLPWRRL